MRMVSTFVAAGFSVLCFGAVAAAQDISFTTSNLNELRSGVPAAEFRVAPQGAPTMLAATAGQFTVSDQPAHSFIPADGAMTAPAAPGSGFSVDLPSAALAMGVADQPAFSVSDVSGGAAFSTADGAPSVSFSAGVAPLLGIETSTALTAAVTPDSSLLPAQQLGR